MPEPVIYLGAAEVAALFGVQPDTIGTWRRRYPDFPEPDAYTGRPARCEPDDDAAGRVAGWLPSREVELRAWERSRPGRGAGGGRPRKGG